MDYRKELILQSNKWYNDGLERVSRRDMSGAIVSLRKSLQYNKANIAARNLLGLVFFGIGEVAEALVEWIISKNLKTHGNIANYYIKKLQETPQELEIMNQTIKKYNQSLAYCRQAAEDLALIQLKKVVAIAPNFLKAHHLLAFLYINAEQYSKARQVLRKAHKLDTTSEFTLRYMNELVKHQKSQMSKLKEDTEQTVTYTLGNETIIQPAASGYKEQVTGVTIANIVIGVILGAAIIGLLVFPAFREQGAKMQNEEILAYSEQISALKSELDGVNQEIEGYRAQSEQTLIEKERAQNMQENYEKILLVLEWYNGNTHSNMNMAEELLTISRDELEAQGQAIYDRLSADIFPDVSSAYMTNGDSSYSVGNYAAAITAYEKVIAIQENYEDGRILLMLGNAYFKSEDVDNANKSYKRVIELYPDSEYAEKAQSGIDGEPVD